MLFISCFESEQAIGFDMRAGNYHSGVALKELIRMGGARSWEPEMLVFGIKNLNIYTLPSKSWDGLYLGLHLRKSVGSLFQLAYEFHQYVPLEFKKSETAGSQTEAHQVQRSVYGGGKHRVYLVINL